MPSAVGEKVAILRFADVDPAAAAADDHARAGLADASPASFGFTGRNHAMERGARYSPRICPRIVIGRRRRRREARRQRDRGTGAATWQGKVETSNSVTARVPLMPRLTCCQKHSRPTPNVETTPMPEITTRGDAMRSL